VGLGHGFFVGFIGDHVESKEQGRREFSCTNRKHSCTLYIYPRNYYRERVGYDLFWSFDLFITKLDSLIDHSKIRQKGFYLLGQSRGDVLAGMYAARQPEGLLKLALFFKETQPVSLSSSIVEGDTERNYLRSSAK
jgi:hypothetical protein